MRIRCGKQSAVASSAFTLVEVVVAIMVVGIVFVSLYSGITFGTDLIASARENLRATQVLEQKLEEIRLFNWTQLNSNGFVPSSFTAYFDPYASNQNNELSYSGSVWFTNAPLGAETYNSNMMMVVVQVQWTTGKTLQTRTMNSLVSQYGMQNYVY